MEKRDKIYEGKAKIVYTTDKPGLVIQYFKDDATAFNAEKRGTIVGKGVVNNRMSATIFERLGQGAHPHPLRGHALGPGDALPAARHHQDRDHRPERGGGEPRQAHRAPRGHAPSGSPSWSSTSSPIPSAIR